MKLYVSKQAMKLGYGCRELEDALTVDKDYTTAFCELIDWNYIVKFEDGGGNKFIGQCKSGQPRESVTLKVIEVGHFEDNLYQQFFEVVSLL